MSSKKMKNKKTPIIITAAVLLVAAAAVWLLFFRTASGDAVYVMPVSAVSVFSTGSANRYGGMVEPQQTVEFRKDSSKTVRETYVQEGDAVKFGDVLFSYDSDAIYLEIAQKELDIQREQAAIASNNELIDMTDDDLERQRLRNQNLQTEYRIKALRNELSSLEASAANTDVVCNVDGTVKSVSDGTDGSDVYITVMKAGDYIVKGKISEMNIASLPQGTSVAIHSRVDDTVWNGTVSRIDTNQTAENQQGMYIGGKEEESGSKYYFYVELENSKGLFLGQHVIVKPLGAGSKEGLWLFEDYIEGAGSDDPFVWADNSGRIRKRHVELGDYDAETGCWKVLSGLSVSDYIAYPDGTVSDGMKTTTEYPASEPEGFEMPSEENFGSYVPEEEPVPGTEPEESEVSG